MKTIIAGSRDFTDEYQLTMTMASLPWEVTEVVSGGARGADSVGEAWAKTMGIPIRSFIPDWNRYGRRAGHIRNREMAVYVDTHCEMGGALVAFWNGISYGTANMIDTARTFDIITHIEMV